MERQINRRRINNVLSLSRRSNSLETILIKVRVFFVSTLSHVFAHPQSGPASSLSRDRHGVEPRGHVRFLPPGCTRSGPELSPEVHPGRRLTLSRGRTARSRHPERRISRTTRVLSRNLWGHRPRFHTTDRRRIAHVRLLVQPAAATHAWLLRSLHGFSHPCLLENPPMQAGRDK